jgi:putative PIN family toxin of toxin-antitoxin system
MIPNRVILDTNVCLDLFVFRDPRRSDLLAALEHGTIEAVTRDDCRREWQIVLNYPHLPLDGQSRITAATEFDRLISRFDAVAAARDTCLPVCSDPDDQKFLELAFDAEAAVLLTKDKALLKLARKTAKTGLFLIVHPDKWTFSIGLASLPTSPPPTERSGKPA